MFAITNILPVKLFQIVFLLVISVYQCKGQVKKTNDSNLVSFRGKLQEYTIDSCLRNVLWAIVEADSASLNYPPKTFFYELDFECDAGGNKEITIFPSRWLRSAVLDYKGIIRIGGMSFLCNGNLIKAPLFIETNRYVDVTLVRPKPYYYDSVDVKIEMFVRKPSLVGKYTFCKGGPINLLILVGRKLEGFATKKIAKVILQKFKEKINNNKAPVRGFCIMRHTLF